MVLQILDLHTLHVTRYHLDAIFVFNVMLGSKSFPSSMDIIGVRVPTRIESFFRFMLVLPSKNFPSPYVPLGQIQFVAMLMSSEDKLPHLDLIILLVYY